VAVPAAPFQRACPSGVQGSSGTGYGGELRLRYTPFLIYPLARCPLPPPSQGESQVALAEANLRTTRVETHIPKLDGLG
jgi:hypothetical protein